MNRDFKEQLHSYYQQIRAITGVYRKAIKDYGIAENEFWIWYSLVVLDHECTQQDICDTWSLTKQTVNTIIMNLKKQGLLSLETVPGTKNRKKICLTEEGRRYGERIVLPVYQAEQAAVNHMPPEKCAACMETLELYHYFLQKELQHS